MDTSDIESERGIVSTIDPQVRDLVKAIGCFQETYASCEGHLDGRKRPYPWVRLLNSPCAELKEILLSYNKDAIDKAKEAGRRPITWEIDRTLRPSQETLSGYGITPAWTQRFLEETMKKDGFLLPPIDKKELDELQESARNLAKRLATITL